LQFRQATQLDAQFASAWAGLCEAQLAQYNLISDRRHFDDAEQSCTRALQLDADRVEVHIALGALYRTHGDLSRAEATLQSAQYAKAEAVLEQALHLDANTIEGMLELGQVYAAQNRLDEAQKEFLKAENISPNNWQVQRALFSFYQRDAVQESRFEHSLQHAEKAQHLRPDLAASWNNLGTAHYMLKQYDEAAQAWQHSLEINPTRTAYTNTGLAFYYSGNFAGAAQMQRKATELAPRDHRAWGRLGDALKFSQSEPQQAIETFSHAAELARESLAVNASDWRTLAQLAVYLAQTGDFDSARDSIAQAMQLSEGKSEVLFSSALVNCLADDVDACLDDLERAVQQDAEYRHLVVNEPEFRTLANEPRFQSIISGT
jgi:tetratricopeptide (TPR) repeat protein